MVGVDRLVEATTRWYLAHDAGGPLEEQIAAAEAPFARLIAVLPDIGADEWREHRRATSPTAWSSSGVPEDVAWAHALMPELMQAPDIIAVAERTRAAGRGGHARVPRARRAARRSSGCSARSTTLPQPTRTQRWAVQAVREDCLEALAELARCALASAAEGQDAVAAVDAYLDARAALSRRLAAVTASLTVEGTGDLPALMLAVRAVRALAG